MTPNELRRKMLDAIEEKITNICEELNKNSPKPWRVEKGWHRRLFHLKRITDEEDIKINIEFDDDKEKLVFIILSKGVDKKIKISSKKSAEVIAKEFEKRVLLPFEEDIRKEGIRTKNYVILKEKTTKSAKKFADKFNLIQDDRIVRDKEDFRDCDITISFLEDEVSLRLGMSEEHADRVLTFYFKLLNKEVNDEN